MESYTGGAFLMTTRILLTTICLALALTGSTLAAGPQIDVPIHLRVRWETWGSPSGNPDLETDFDYWKLRARVGLDLEWEHWTLHGVLQGAAGFGLPENGAFGIGPVYVGANDGDTDPSQVGVAEASVGYRSERFRMTLGRQGWKDGLEILTGVPHLDQVKKTRLSERLVGNWDWVNVGRRYDGFSFGVDFDSSDLSGFALRPLAGGVNYIDAFESLDDLNVYGLTLTGRYGKWISGAELRLFGLLYDDGRPGAVAVAGGDIQITTLGASLLLGGERRDLMLWTAFQRGDWGPVDQEGWAFIVEGGYAFPDAIASPGIRLGIAQASGGELGGDSHSTFFNLLPTNHKFYGSIDFSAFSNLQDIYALVLLKPGAKTNLRIGLHTFALDDTSDAWYGGSGAFDEQRLGYVARRPAGGGSFSSDSLGNEIDIQANWSFKHGLGLGAGLAFFNGGSAAREILSVDDNGTWGWIQFSWKY
jgi:hypothetical protein